MQRELDATRVRLSTAEDDALERMVLADLALATMQAASADVAAREEQRRRLDGAHARSPGITGRAARSIER